MRLPNDTQRLAIVGTTGSGKTQAAAWHLSRRRFDLMPWIVYDFKTDELLNQITGAQHITVNDLPTAPGVYLVHPHPDDLEGVMNQMWKMWSRENVGCYVDEGYMVSGNGRTNPAFRSLLTQGRSKRIPMIVLSQRPVWLDRFVFSESEFYQVFRLNDRRDRQSVTAFAPVDLDTRIPDFYSWYYDVGQNEVSLLKPVPTAPEILTAFDAKFEVMKDTKRRVIL